MRLIQEGRAILLHLGNPVSQHIHPCGDQISYCRYLEQACLYADDPHLCIRGWDASGANGSVVTAHIILLR